MKAFISELTALAVVVLSSICLVYTGEVNIPHVFNAGEEAVAAEVNENFAAVKTAVDDNDSRINTSADAIGANADAIDTNNTATTANADAIAVNSTEIASSRSSAKSYTNGPLLILKALLILTIPFYMMNLQRK